MGMAAEHQNLTRAHNAQTHEMKANCSRKCKAYVSSFREVVNTCPSSCGLWNQARASELGYFLLLIYSFRVHHLSVLCRGAWAGSWLTSYHIHTIVGVVVVGVSSH